MEEFAKQNLQSLTETPDLDENGDFIINQKFNSINNISLDQIQNFFSQNNRYQSYSVAYDNH